jgi:hypothetical protein
MACWSPAYLPPFSYDPATGRCIDELGRQGTNPQPQWYVRETGNGECSDLTSAGLNETDFNNPVIEWNLAGALLDGASLFFAHFDNTDLRGASLADFSFGYATIQALVDRFTTPDFCGEPDASGWVGCQQ